MRVEFAHQNRDRTFGRFTVAMDLGQPNAVAGALRTEQSSVTAENALSVVQNRS